MTVSVYFFGLDQKVPIHRYGLRRAGLAATPYVVYAMPTGLPLVRRFDPEDMIRDVGGGMSMTRGPGPTVLDWDKHGRVSCHWYTNKTMNRYEHQFVRMATAVRARAAARRILEQAVGADEHDAPVWDGVLLLELGSWTVTHEQSGLAMVTGMTRRDAEALVRQLAPLADYAALEAKEVAKRQDVQDTIRAFRSKDKKQ